MVAVLAATVVRAQGDPPPIAPATATPVSDTMHAPTGAAAPESDDEDDVPFSVGERAVYDAKFGIIHVGTGFMEVVNVQNLRDHDAWHTRFAVKGGTLFYHVNDTLESWFDTHTLSSLRFLQRLDEGGHVRNRNYEIFPDRSVFVFNNKPEQPSVPEPLDDGSFLYFVRTLPLKVGDTYTSNRYFNPKANPVVIRVLRKERIHVPAGTFDAIVVQPIIKTSGIFSEHGEAQVWVSDDSARVVLQLKSKLSFGSLDLYLKSFEPGRGAAASQPSGPAPPAPQGVPSAPPPAAAHSADSAPPPSSKP